jgi:hypothetical protein
VTLVDDSLIFDLLFAMGQFGYSYVSSSPTTPRRTQNLLVDFTDPGITTDPAPASTFRVRYDNAKKALMMSQGGSAFFPLAVNVPDGASFFEDFLSFNGTNIGDHNFVGATSGFGSSAATTAIFVSGIRQGMLSLQTGTTSTGRGSARQQGPSYTNVGASLSGQSSIEWFGTLGGPLSVAGESYTLACGWSDNAGVAGFGANAALFVHDLAVHPTNWVAKAVVLGVPVNVDTGFAIAPSGTFQKLRIDIVSGVGATFFVNGVAGPTFALATLPSSGLNPWSPFAKIEKTAGGTTRFWHQDYVSWMYRLTSPR